MLHLLTCPLQSVTQDLLLSQRIRSPYVEGTMPGHRRGPWPGGGLSRRSMEWPARQGLPWQPAAPLCLLPIFPIALPSAPTSGLLLSAALFGCCTCEPSLVCPALFNNGAVVPTFFGSLCLTIQALLACARILIGRYSRFKLWQTRRGTRQSSESRPRSGSNQSSSKERPSDISGACTSCY